MNGAAYLQNAIRRFRAARDECERAFAQVPVELWSRRLDPESNSIVTLMLHLSGNMRSRWTDFLTSDGEKPDRDRDADAGQIVFLARHLAGERWKTLSIPRGGSGTFNAAKAGESAGR